jgi:hypothetical protein
MEIDLNKLSTKEVFELIDKVNNHFTSIKGWGLIKNNLIEDFDESSYLVESGLQVDEELIQEFFNEFEYNVEDGFYEFRFLLSYSSAQIGNYPPPNIECQAYYDYYDSIFDLKVSLEDYTKGIIYEAIADNPF